MGQRRDFLQFIDELESVPIRKGTKASIWDACDPEVKGGFKLGSGRPRGPKTIRKLGRKAGRQASKLSGRQACHAQAKLPRPGKAEQ